MIKDLHRYFPPMRVVRWMLIGVLFMGINLPFLFVLVELCHLPVPVGTFITAVIGTLSRFLINDRFVFQHRRPTWIRVRTYCTAIALGAAVWYAVANTLPWFGVHYLIAAVAASACSVVFNLTSNFLWVWRDCEKPLDP